MTITGVIHGVNIEGRYFSIQIGKRVTYFYLQNNLMKRFRKYLNVGRFVSFEFDEHKVRIIRPVKAFQVTYFIKIFSKKTKRNEVHYDLSQIRGGIKSLINNVRNTLFLDLEMTMQDYQSPRGFKPEIIQAGILVCDRHFNTLEKHMVYVKPTRYPRLTKRTQRFLNLDSDTIDGIEYLAFYDLFKRMVKTYKPAIIVWGKNDILALKDSYEINQVEPLDLHTTYINLLQIQKNYFNLKNDLGLFRALELYTEEKSDQAHDALEDAIATQRVFVAFKKAINSKKPFTIVEK